MNNSTNNINFFTLLCYLLSSIALSSILLPSQAQAATCTITANPTALSLGSTSSFSVQSSTPLTISGPGGITCSGLTVGLLGGSTLTGTLTTSTNSMNLVNTQNSSAKIPYTLYADNTTSHPFVMNTAMDYGPNGLNLLGLLFIGAGGSVTVYVRTTPSQNIPAGTYTDTITIYWSYSMCLLNVAGICVNLSPPDTGTSTIQVNLTVTKDCLISTTPNVEFGSSAFVDTFPSITTNAVSLSCTSQTTYQTYFTNGNNYVSPWRQMVSSTNPANLLQYNIYYPDKTTIWSSANPQSGTGTGLSQSIPYVATINPNQAAKPTGSYSDTLQFVVVY